MELNAYNYTQLIFDKYLQICAEKKGYLSMNDSGEIGHTKISREDIRSLPIFCLKFDSKDFNGSPKTENIWKIH